jgi:hypothetical protein
MSRFLVAALLALTIWVVLEGQTPRSDVPLGWFSISPDQLKWTKLTDGTGRETATVFGDRTKHTLFGYAVRWQPNTIAKAHSHPDTRYVVVRSLTFYHGQGKHSTQTSLNAAQPARSFPSQRVKHTLARRKANEQAFTLLESGPTELSPSRSENLHLTRKTVVSRIQLSP